jgi:hypothetical protein
MMKCESIKNKEEEREREREEGKKETKGVIKEEPIYMHVHINARFAVYYMII